MSNRRVKKGKTVKFLYFFYNGALHRKISINRGTDIITAWSFQEHKMCKYSYLDVKKNGGKAYTTNEVIKMLGRGPVTIYQSFKDGHIPAPARPYSIETRQTNKRYPYMWSEEHIWYLHDYLSGIHVGRPRQDGLINTGKLPSRRELKALLSNGTVLYVKDDEGNFHPTWDAEKF